MRKPCYVTVEALGEPQAPVRALAAHMMGNLGVALAGLDRYKDAAALFAGTVDLLNKGVMLAPDETEQLFRSYADCLRKIGNKREARQIEARGKTVLNDLPRDPARGLVVDASQLALRR
jgi:hypothetical protein